MCSVRRVILIVALGCLPLAAVFAGEKERFFQFGLISPLGSNGVGSGRVVNTVSVNLLGGYSAGTKAFEIGGMWNADMNYTGGLQMAGLVNYTGCSRNSVQISGLANISSSGKSPFQLGGLVNVGDNVTGVQISGLVNVADRLGGVQVGLINYAEESDGVSIGLINIVRHGGKYEFEVSFSEVINTIASFRIGTDNFYTIFSGGVHWFGTPVEYAVGLGFGTSVGWGREWSSQIEVQAFGLTSEGSFSDMSQTSIAQLRIPVCWELSRHFKIFAGPSLNFAFRWNDDNAAVGDIVPWPVWNIGNSVSSWLGFTAGFRF